MTLTYFRAMSTWVTYAFEWVNLLKCQLKGKTCRKLTNGQDIDYFEEKKWPQGFICPFTGVFVHNIQTCLLVWYIQEISGGPLVLWFLLTSFFHNGKIFYTIVTVCCFMRKNSQIWRCVNYNSLQYFPVLYFPSYHMINREWKYVCLETDLYHKIYHKQSDRLIF